MNESDRKLRFDAVSASHGAASVALIAFLTASGLLIVFQQFEDPVPIGKALLTIAAVHLSSLFWIGAFARPGRRAGRFSFRAASHGASALCITSFVACAGFMCLVRRFSDSQTAYGVCLLISAASSLVGFLAFGWLSETRNLDVERRSYADSSVDNATAAQPKTGS